MRLFTAIPMPEHVKEQLAEFQQPIEGVRWQDKDKLHLTLKFLGDTDAQKAEKLQEELQEIELNAFSLTLKGFGYFPEGKKPSVLWAGIEPNDSLTSLYQSIEQVCTSLGFEEDNRSFKPHVTVARVNGGRKRDVMSFINQHKQFRIDNVRIEEFVLYESKLHPDGARHIRLKSFSLERGK